MEHTTFIDCRFSGQYAGCEFGPKFGDSPGRVKNCDFSAARLNMTEFYDCNVDSLQWPDWPHIHLLYGEDLSWTRQLSDASLPQRLLSLIRLGRHEDITPRTVLSVHLPSLDCDPEVVWPLVQDNPHIWFASKAQKPKAATAEVDQALLANQEALSKLQRTRQRTTLLGNLHRSWLRSAKRMSDGDVELAFDCSFLRERVPGAPELVHIRLHRGSAHHRFENSIREIDGELDRFMLMGVGEEDDKVVLKPHRKERGQVILSFETYSVHDEENKAVTEEVILNAVRQYYALNES